MSRPSDAVGNAQRSSTARRWIVAMVLAMILMALPAELPVETSWTARVELSLRVATADAAHPFYESRLTEGTLALEQERPREAARLLEIAAFGLLDEPPRLAEALVRLALAQAEVGETGAFRETVRRVAEIEERFGAYLAADLSAGERAAFDRRITELTPASELDRSPGLQRLLQPPAEAGEGGTTEDRTEDRTEHRSAVQGAGIENGGVEGGDGRPAASATPVRSTPVPEPSVEERERLERAREILARARRASELDEAWTLARPIADAHPARRDLHQLVGEIAYRSSRWEEAALYLEKGLAPVDGADDSARGSRPQRPELLFYLAVALFESGRPGEAVAPLELALPRLERTPFVRSYVEKILQPSSDATSSSPTEGDP